MMREDEETPLGASVVEVLCVLEPGRETVGEDACRQSTEVRWRKEAIKKASVVFVFEQHL